MVSSWMQALQERMQWRGCRTTFISAGCKSSPMTSAVLLKAKIIFSNPAAWFKPLHLFIDFTIDLRWRLQLTSNRFLSNFQWKLSYLICRNWIYPTNKIFQLIFVEMYQSKTHHFFHFTSFSATLQPSITLNNHLKIQNKIWLSFFICIFQLYQLFRFLN